MFHPDVKARAIVQGIAWTAVWRCLAQAVSWLGTLYVAHILTLGRIGRW